MYNLIFLQILKTRKNNICPISIKRGVAPTAGVPILCKHCNTLMNQSRFSPSDTVSGFPRTPAISFQSQTTHPFLIRNSAECSEKVNGFSFSVKIKIPEEMHLKNKLQTTTETQWWFAAPGYSAMPSIARLFVFKDCNLQNLPRSRQTAPQRTPKISRSFLSCAAVTDEKNISGNVLIYLSFKSYSNTMRGVFEFSGNVQIWFVL